MIPTWWLRFIIEKSEQTVEFSLPETRTEEDWVPKLPTPQSELVVRVCGRRSGKRGQR